MWLGHKFFIHGLVLSSAMNFSNGSFTNSTAPDPVSTTLNKEKSTIAFVISAIVVGVTNSTASDPVSTTLNKKKSSIALVISAIVVGVLLILMTLVVLIDMQKVHNSSNQVKTSRDAFGRVKRVHEPLDTEYEVPSLAAPVSFPNDERDVVPSSQALITDLQSLTCNDAHTDIDEKASKADLISKLTENKVSDSVASPSVSFQ